MIYPYKITHERFNGVWYYVGESLALSGCVSQGKTLDEAVKELEENEIEWLETAKEYGFEIPKVGGREMKGSEKTEEEKTLKPCPFCGEKGNVARGYISSGQTWSYDSYCQNCGAMIECDSEEEAIEAWNRRAK